MKKTFRRIIFLLLAIVMSTTMALTATARPEPPVSDAELVSKVAAAQSETPDSSMETALIAAKTLIKIDDDVYTDFSYSSSYSNYETMEGVLWTFYWTSEDNAQIYATVTADGVLLYFRMYKWDEKSFGFADVSKSAAIAAADAFIKKANPDTYTFYKAPAEVYTELGSSEYGISYRAEVNGYHFDAAQISVSINKYTGEVTGYGTNKTDPSRYKFEDATGIIAESAAVIAYADKIGLNLEYGSYFDYENKKLKVFPVYKFNPDWSQYIGAKSGDVVTYVYDVGVDDVTGINSPPKRRRQ